LISEILGTLVIATLFGVIIFFLAQRFGVSLVPSISALVVFSSVALAVRIPSSALYLAPSDGTYFVEWGFSIYEDWGNGEAHARTIWPGKGIWPLIIATIYFFFGPVTVPLYAFNIFIMVATVLFLQKTVLLSTGRHAGFAFVALTLSSPALMIWGTSLFREALFWCGVSLGGLAVSFISSRQNWAGLGSILSSGVLLVAIRPDYGSIVWASLLVVIAVVYQPRVFFRSSVILFGRLLTVVSITGLFLFVFPLLNSVESSQRVDAIRDYLGREGVTTAVDAPQIPSNATPLALESLAENNVYVKLVLEGVFGLPAVWWGASAWSSPGLPNLSESVLLFGVLHFVFVATLALVYVVRVRRVAELGIVFTSIAASLVVASLATNFGIALRFRAVAEILLIPLAVGGINMVAHQITSVVKSFRSPSDN